MPWVQCLFVASGQVLIKSVGRNIGENQLVQGECVVLQDLDNRCIADFVELFQGEIPEKADELLTRVGLPDKANAP